MRGDSTGPGLSNRAKKSGGTCLQIGNQWPFVLVPVLVPAPPKVPEARDRRCLETFQTAAPIDTDSFGLRWT